MPYTKHNYQKGDELLASQLNDMDDQIALNEQTAGTNNDYIIDATNGVNYGYASYFKRDGNPSSSDSLRLGVTQIYNRIILDGDISNISDAIKVRVNSGVATTVMSQTVEKWTTGIALTTGHTYRAVLKYLGDKTFTVVPTLSVYRKGESTSVGNYTYAWPEFIREFTAEQDVIYNFVIYLAASSFTFNNDEFLITVTDITQEIIKDDLLSAWENLDSKINYEHNLVNYGYGKQPQILVADPSAPSGISLRIGAERYGTRYKLNYAGGIKVPSRVKISNGFERIYGTNYQTYARTLQLQSGHTYEYVISHVSGSSTLDGKPWVPRITAYDESTSETICTVIELTSEKIVYRFTATESKLLLCIYIHNSSIITDYVCDITLRDITEEISGSNSYYAPEIADTVTKVQDEVTEPSLVFLWSTDNHRMSANAANVQNFSYMVQNMGAVAKQVKVDFNLCTGDLTDGNQAKNTTLSRAYDCMTEFESIGVPFVWAMGNHDTNPYISSGALILNLAESYKAYFAHTKGVIYNQSENGTDYYIDFDNLDTRLICLNANNSAGGSYYTYGTTTASWLTTALDTNKNVIVALHQSPIASQVYDNRSTTRAAGITSALNAFVNNGGNLIMLSGHSHCDAAYVSPFVSIMQCCQRFSSIAEDITDETHSMTGFIDVVRFPAREQYTATEDCWSVGVYKPNSNELSMIRFGAGKDRYFHITPIAPATLTSKLSGTLTWASSNDAVATVADGVVTGVASGKCAILAKDEAENYECWIVNVT